MKKMTLILTCGAALLATPALAREPVPQSQAEIEHHIEAAARQAAAAQQLIADHASEHGKDTRGWPCCGPGSEAVAKALKETALVLAEPAHRHAVSVGRYSPTMRDCGACDDCPDCDICTNDRCLETIQTRRSGIKVDCVDCPGQVSLA